MRKYSTSLAGRVSPPCVLYARIVTPRAWGSEPDGSVVTRKRASDKSKQVASIAEGRKHLTEATSFSRQFGAAAPPPVE